MSAQRPFSYMHLAQAGMLEELYAQFLDNPLSVEPSWRYFFEGVAFGKYEAPGALSSAGADAVRISNLRDAYRRLGHYKAHVNPLQMAPPESPPELSLSHLGFQSSELSRAFPTCGIMSVAQAPLSAIIEALEHVYCGSKGIEYMDFGSIKLEKWIQNAIEPSHFSPSFSIEQKRQILNLLNQAELFETFLHTKYVGQKRFSLEGGETLIPMLAELIERGSELGIKEFEIGMSHRGRLNVLANILKKSYSMIFSEFEDYEDPSLGDVSKDVKYHRGFSSQITSASGMPIHVSVTANPSHLESVDPVVEGKARAKQEQGGDRKTIMPILIHGDAALSGQGVVYETLQMYHLPAYSTGGTIHIVVNNQIGFTTLPKEYRSTNYCTDLARAFGFPVFHLNAEDPEGCVYAAQLAVKLRAELQSDVFLELNCYRKYGHNEGDEPAFTQPLEYQIIRKKKTIRELYRDTLIQEGSLEKGMALQLEEEFKKSLHFELDELQIKKTPSSGEAFGGIWKEYIRVNKKELFTPIQTGVERGILEEISKLICQIPKNLTIHKKLISLLDERKKMGAGERPFDWAMAELLSFGTLLLEGVPVRLSGQDCQRGTFTQRHAVLVDQISGEEYCSLAHLKNGQQKFTIANSPLSEFAILGFEYGYSLAYPSSLVLWEAQFGDFANGGQVIFDQYLSSSSKKWQRYSGLVVLLPHGYEGQGPEHSSARIERFLQMAAEWNLQVAYPTTPAQYFHLLRRQMKRKIRLPLIIFTPKGLLRHPQCVSSLDELSNNRFYEILDDPKGKPEATRLILCSGRIFYDLDRERELKGAHHVAIIRIEQLYPLFQEELKELIGKYPSVNQFYWVQEEPRNMGAYRYIQEYLIELLPPGTVLHYVGRSSSAATASGSHSVHEKEHRALLEKAFG